MVPTTYCFTSKYRVIIDIRPPSKQQNKRLHFNKKKLRILWPDISVKRTAYSGLSSCFRKVFFRYWRYQYWVYCIEIAEFFLYVHCLQHYYLWQTSKCFFFLKEWNLYFVKWAERVMEVGSFLIFLWMGRSRTWQTLYRGANVAVSVTWVKTGSHHTSTEHIWHHYTCNHSTLILQNEWNGNVCMWNAVWFVEWFAWSNCTYLFWISWHNSALLTVNIF